MARERDYSNEQIVGLLRFIDLLVTLPKNLEQEIDTLINEKFITMKTGRVYKTDMHLSNIMHESIYGETYDAREERNKLAFAKKVGIELLKMGFSYEKIAQVVQFPIETVIELLEEEPKE